jgi:hypothetical protein
MASIQDQSMSLRLLGGVPQTTTKYSPSGNTTVSTFTTAALPKNRFYRLATSAAIEVVFGTNVSTMAPVNVGMYIPANSSITINNGSYTRMGFIGNGNIYVTEMDQAFELPLQLDAGDNSEGWKK